MISKGLHLDISFIYSKFKQNPILTRVDIKEYTMQTLVPFKIFKEMQNI